MADEDAPAEEPVLPDDEVGRAFQVVIDWMFPPAEQFDPAIEGGRELMILACWVAGDFDVKLTPEQAREKVVGYFTEDFWSYANDWINHCVEAVLYDYEESKRPRVRPTEDVVETL